MGRRDQAWDMWFEALPVRLPSAADRLAISPVLITSQFSVRARSDRAAASHPYHPAYRRCPTVHSVCLNKGDGNE